MGRVSIRPVLMRLANPAPSETEWRKYVKLPGRIRARLGVELYGGFTLPPGRLG